MSTKLPATSTMPSTWATERPRSRTWVMPRSRGLELRDGRSSGEMVLLRLVGAHRDHDVRGIACHGPGARVDRRDLVRRDADDARDVESLAAVAVGVGDL